MKAQALYRKGALDEAVSALENELRDDPTDLKRRTFLFELLCFSGKRDRADKQLDVIAAGGKEAAMGSLIYRSALHADRQREAMFAEDSYPQPAKSPPRVRGTLNGKPFNAMEDADPRIGARLEVYAAGEYTWFALEHIASLSMDEPKRLRDLLWIPARVDTGPMLKTESLGEVLIPVLSPFSWQSEDNDIRLGRATDWLDAEDGPGHPIGQKVFLVDDEPVSLLSIRELVIEGPADEDN